MSRKHQSGDNIQVSNDGKTWFTRIFLAEVNSKYICVDVEWVEAYRKGGEPYMCMAWTYCIRYDVPMTLDEAVEYLTDNFNNRVQSDDGYIYIGYEGIGIMYAKKLRGQTNKFFKLKPNS